MEKVISKLQSSLESFPGLTARQALATAGNLIALNVVLGDLCVRQTRDLYRFANSQQSYDVVGEANDCVKQEIVFWLDILRCSNNTRFLSRGEISAVFLSSDASDYGWRGILHEKSGILVAGEQLPVSCIGQSSCFRELYAAYSTLLTFSSFLKEKNVIELSDYLRIIRLCRQYWLKRV